MESDYSTQSVYRESPHDKTTPRILIKFNYKIFLCNNHSILEPITKIYANKLLFLMCAAKQLVGKIIAVDNLSFTANL